MGLVQQVTINTTYRILFLVFQLLNTVLISRSIGAAGFGLYSLVTVNANVLLVFTSLGIPAGIVYHASAKDYALPRMERIIWFSTLFQILLVIGLEFIHFRLFDRFWIWPAAELWTALAGVILFLAIVIAEKYYALYNGFQHLSSYNLIVLIFSVMQFLVLIFLTQHSSTQNLQAMVILTFVIVQALQSVFLVVYFYMRKIGKLRIAEAAEVRKKFFTYSLYAFLANALFFLLTRVDFWILNHFRGEAELGWYALATRIAQMFLILPIVFSGIVLPSITAKKISTDNIQAMFRILNTVNLLMMFALAIISPWLMPLLFGKDFTSSSMPLIVLLPGLFFLAAQTLLAAYFAGIGKPEINFRSNLISLGFILALDFVLIPKNGAVGAAIAASISYFLGFTNTYIQYIKSENYTWSSLLVIRSDIEKMNTLIRNALKGELSGR